MRLAPGEWRKKRKAGEGEEKAMEPKTSGSFWGKGPDGPAACRAGGGGGLGGPELIALLLECVPMVPWQGRAFAPSLRLFPSPSFYAQR